MATSLRPYQQDAVDTIQREGRLLLALPPGAGKTAIVAAALGEGRKLIVAPNGPVIHHWQVQAREWGHFHVANGTGSAKRRQGVRQGRHSVVMNYEAFRVDIDYVLAQEWDAVVFDESHRLKNRQSQTFKAAARIAKVAPRLVLVTGTPVLNRATELWSSLHLLDPAKYRSFWRWAEYHFHIVTPRYRRRIVREVCSDEDCNVCGGKGYLPGHERMLVDEIRGKMFYRPIKEILPDLPELVETYHHVELNRDERKAYDSMVKDAWMEIGEDIIEAPLKIAQNTRLRQLASDWSVWSQHPGTKAKAAAELVAELDGEQVLIFCAYRNTTYAVAELIPGARAYHGGLDPERREQLKEAFIAGEVPVLVATIATLGEGVDGLQVARNAIFIDRDWTPARNEQAWRRLLRLGQKSSVNVMHIVADDTIDQVVSHALEVKQDVIRAIIEDRRGA